MQPPPTITTSAVFLLGEFMGGRLARAVDLVQKGCLPFGHERFADDPNDYDHHRDAPRGTQAYVSRPRRRETRAASRVFEPGGPLSFMHAYEQVHGPQGAVASERRDIHE